MGNFPEDDLQMSVARYLDALGLLWNHCANERKTTKIKGGRLKKKGVKSGVPDCMIYEAKNGYNGLAIELKIRKGTVSDNQKEWLKRLSEKGWSTHVCYNLDEVIREVKFYLET